MSDYAPIFIDLLSSPINTKIFKATCTRIEIWKHFLIFTLLKETFIFPLVPNQTVTQNKTKMLFTYRSMLCHNNHWSIASLTKSRALRRAQSWWLCNSLPCHWSGCRSALSSNHGPHQGHNISLSRPSECSMVLFLLSLINCALANSLYLTRGIIPWKKIHQ